MALLSLIAAGARASDKDTGRELVCFYSTSCDKCMRVKDEVLPVLEERFRARITVVCKDVGDIGNYKSLFDLKKRYGRDDKAVFPVLFLNGNFIDKRDLPDDDDAGRIASFITASLETAGTEAGAPDGAGPLGAFRKFTLPAVALAGFVDGINPCSFTIIVFFISFLSLRGYDKRHMAWAGCAFILASFLTYLGIGLGLFGPLYAAREFRSVTGTVTLAVGVLSCVLGVVSVYDAFTFLRTGRPDGSLLKLPAGIRDKIRREVHDAYLPGKRGRLSARAGRGVSGIFFTSLAVGFSVSILESVCTGQLYIPTILFVLKTTPHNLQAIYCLILYNLALVAPLLAILSFALAGMSWRGFAMFMEKRFFIIKALMAALFLALGASLVFAEEAIPATGRDPDRKPRSVTLAKKPDKISDDFYWDFGNVKEGDVLRHRFIVKNDIDVPIKIGRINTSCACTTSKVERDTVSPGEETSLDVQFDTKRYPGKRVRYIYVHTDSKKMGIIAYKIKANVARAARR